MSTGISSTWFSRPAPADHPLVRKAIRFGNDPATVIQAFMEGPWYIRCLVCDLPTHFCKGASGVRCFNRPEYGPEDDERIQRLLQQLDDDV